LGKHPAEGLVEDAGDGGFVDAEEGADSGKCVWFVGCGVQEVDDLVPVGEHGERRGRQSCVDFRRTSDFPVDCHVTINPSVGRSVTCQSFH
jgi:hypothetical protein